MASSYPTGLDSFATNRADATTMATTHKDDHNNANDAVNKIEAELGINPSGSSTTVADRFTAIEGSGTEFVLASATSVGATTVTVSSTPLLGMNSKASVIAIGVGATTCELRRITGITGSVLTLDRALGYTHSAADPVVWLAGNGAPISWFGAKGNFIGDAEINDEPAVQAAINQCQAADIWVDGMNSRYILNGPLVLPQSTKIRSVQKFKAGAAYAPLGADDWMVMTCQDRPQTFTVDTGTNTFTTPASHGIGGATNRIVFKGASLPSPLVSGRIYYVNTIPTGSTFTVSATSGGAILDVTTAGSGAMTVYPDAVTLEKVYLSDVRVDGAGIAPNGFYGGLQQPHEMFKFYLESFLGTGMKLYGQQFSIWNLVIIGCDVGLELGDAAGSCSFGYFYGVSLETNGTANLRVGNAIYCGFWGLHFEVSATHVHFPSTADVRNFTIDTAIFPISAVMTGVLCESGLVGYTLRNSSPYGGADEDVWINDTGRDYTLTRADIGDFVDTAQHSEPYFVQPYHLNGPKGSVLRIPSKTTAYTAKRLDNLILANASGAAFSVTLPAAALRGQMLTIKKTDSSANAVTVDGNASELIDGAATKVLAAQYDKATLISDGTGWQIV